MPYVLRFHHFLYDVQPKHQNGGAIFANTEGFRPCLGKPSYEAPQWALKARLMQKERLKSPHKLIHKLIFLCNRAFLVILRWLKRKAEAGPCDNDRVAV